MTRHQRLVHPEPVEGCYPCKLAAVQVSSRVFATRSEARPGQRAFMDDFAAEFVNGDREAYKRLREQGLQPPTIRGSANLERHAETRYEVETGQVASNGRALRQALQIADDGGFAPLTPAITERAG
jgi:hypothetical protein